MNGSQIIFIFIGQVFQAFPTCSKILEIHIKYKTIKPFTIVITYPLILPFAWGLNTPIMTTTVWDGYT